MDAVHGPVKANDAHKALHISAILDIKLLTTYIYYAYKKYEPALYFTIIWEKTNPGYILLLGVAVTAVGTLKFYSLVLNLRLNCINRIRYQIWVLYKDNSLLPKISDFSHCYGWKREFKTGKLLFHLLFIIIFILPLVYYPQQRWRKQIHLPRRA